MTQAIEWVTYRGAPLYDEDGNLIGSIEEFFVETDDGPPAWVVVVSEADDTDRSYVPVRDARRAEDGQGLQVSVDSDTIRAAPGAQDGNDLSSDEERRLYEHYGQTYPGNETPGQETPGQETPGQETPGQTGGEPRKPGLLRRLFGG